MIFKPMGRLGWLPALVAGVLCCVVACAGDATKDKPAREIKGPPSVTSQTIIADREAIVARASSDAPLWDDPETHPLMPTIRWAKEGLTRVEGIEDYSAKLVKRERIDGKLNDYEQYFVKIRHKPFSVYLRFLTPKSLEGQETIYVEGKNSGNLWGHTVGMRGKIFGTVSLSPTGSLAMANQRYPVTEIGVLNLTKRLIEFGEYDAQFGECEVKTIKNAKINGRSCTCIQVVHPEQRRQFYYHLARIFVDEELNIPVRYESHDWPKEAGGKPQLIEEYTYVDIKLNNGFTDADFDIKNENYGFN